MPPRNLNRYIELHLQLLMLPRFLFSSPLITWAQLALTHLLWPDRTLSKHIFPDLAHPRMTRSLAITIVYRFPYTATDGLCRRSGELLRQLTRFHPCRLFKCYVNTLGGDCHPRTTYNHLHKMCSPIVSWLAGTTASRRFVIPFGASRLRSPLFLAFNSPNAKYSPFVYCNRLMCVHLRAACPRI